MNAPTKLAGFVAVLASVFSLAFAVGTAVGPIGQPAQVQNAKPTARQIEAEVSYPNIPGGLMTSQNGYALELQSTQVQAGDARPIAFIIKGPDGNPVTSFDVEHEKELHLILVRRDFTGFQHLHPQRGLDGTWTVDANVTPGQWRIFADFKPSGAAALTLGADLAVPGTVGPAAELPVSRTATVDGYTVTLTGELVAGAHSMLTLRVSKDGRPVTDLEPYLGAYGHLVALREGDLAYLHVHPGGEPADGQTQPGPDIEFGAEVPSAGGYHLYLDFKHGGVVRTAQFALDASDPSDGTGSNDTGHGHEKS
jgi:hypothetical protein